MSGEYTQAEFRYDDAALAESLGRAIDHINWPGTKRQLIKSGLVVGLVAFAVPILAGLQDGFHWGQFLFCLGFCLLLFPLIMGAFVFESWLRTRRQVLRALRAAGRVRVAIADEGLTRDVGGQVITWRWEIVSKVEVVHGFAAIATKQAESFLIPSRAFGSDSEFDVFVKTVRDRMTSRDDQTPSAQHSS